jgi:hypothetical protein
VDLDFGKVWISAISIAVGAIVGGAIWAQRAAAIVNKAAQAAGDDALIETARQTGTSTLAAAMQGAIGGAILGLVLALAYFYFTDPDRGMKLRRIDLDENG